MNRSPLVRVRRLARYGALALLVASAFLLAVAPASAQATPPFDRTIIVGGGGTDAANGTALLNAINDAVVLGLASPTNPWLVKVEPGIFDIGTATLQMRNFVDVEGSGRNATFIRSQGNPFSVSPTTVNVAAGVDAELRNLTVQYLGSDATLNGAAIRNASSELKLTLVNIEVESPGAAVGFATTNSNPRLSAVFPRVASTNGGTATGMSIVGGGPIINEMFIFIKNETVRANTGIRIERGATPVVEQVSGVVFGGEGNNGILTIESSPRITNNRWTVSDGRAYGIRIQAINDVVDQLVDIKETSIDVRAPRAFGISNEAGGTALVQVKDTRVVARASSGLSAIPVGVTNGNSGSITELDQSAIDANLALLNQTAGTTFRVGATKVGGTRSFAAGSSAICVASYDAAYAPLPPGC